MSDLIRIDVACAHVEEAETIATALIEDRLAACCQITPMTSVYRWEGQVETGSEVRLSIKTRADRFEAVEQRVKALHSYELPQIVATTIVAATEDYANWVRENAT